MNRISDIEDKDLLVLLAQDDEGAFRTLYNRYWKRMLIKAYSKLSSHNDAEEVVQDAFVAIWRKRHTLNIRHSFHTYLSSVVRYAVLNKLAGKKLDLVAIDQLSDGMPAENLADQGLRLKELEAEVERVILDLPERCQLVFRLSRENGLSGKQISEELNISQKTTEAHLTKALKTLRTSLGNIISLTLFLL
jgi:RNA polymerase sigma-70 factor (family 1)